ncbi:MAG TPA: YdcF family protein [Terriglobia bacterium]|nr:YdcF family protein [Terriglobia bacterium]
MEWALYRAIRQQAARDEARPADAIVVFGAAEYNGEPSPVLKARLDHAFDLEERGLAPVVITTGGKGGEPIYSEAGVSRDYLVQKGVAKEKILVDDRSESTYESVQAVASLLRQLHGKTCVAVSDGFHLYRVKVFFRAVGVTAFGSPAPGSPIESAPFDRRLYSWREALSTSLWYLGYKG